MTGIFRAWFVTVVCALVTSAPASVGDDIRVRPLVGDGRVSVSFLAASAFTDDAHAIVESGLLMSFTYTVELRRQTSIWFDRTIGQTVAAASVKLDTLTRMYQVSKQIDGSVVWSERTAEEAQVRTWTTSFERVPLATTETLEPNAEYYVRVRLHASPKRSWSLWPWGRDDGSGRTVFTVVR